MYILELLDISHWLHHIFTLDPDEPFKTTAKIVSMIGTVFTVGTTFVTKTYPWLRAKMDSRSVAKSLGATFFTPSGIERSIRYYIPPNCQTLDPAGSEESRRIHNVQGKLFDTLDNALSPSSR